MLHWILKERIHMYTYVPTHSHDRYSILMGVHHLQCCNFFPMLYMQRGRITVEIKLMCSIQQFL